MTPLRLVMMGTGDFAVPTLESLYGTSNLVAGLFTQPDRTGRGHHQSLQNPMKVVAIEHRTPVFQPENVNATAALDDLRNLNPDLLVVAAYGQILSPELLAIPSQGAINVHASLLPKYRGASPVATAILNGDSETGVSIIQVLPRLDAGPILAIARTPIGPQETAGELEDRLARLGSSLVPGVIEQIAGGSVQPLAQPESLVTRAPKLKKSQGAIDWTRSAAQVDCQVRAMQPWPNPYTFLHSPGKPPLRVLILAVRPLCDRAPRGVPPGTVVGVAPEQLVVETGEGAVAILEIQPDGKRPMTAAAFLRGRAMTENDRFGPETAAG